MSSVFVLHTGIISAIGTNSAENLSALLNGVPGIGLPRILQTTHRFPLGEVPLHNEQLAAATKGSPLWPRTALLSLWAAQEAWTPVQQKAKGLRIGFISANTVGGMDLTDRFYTSFKEDKSQGDLKDVQYHECGAITELTLSGLGLNCWNTTISTACSSSANSIMMAARLIRQNHFDLVIAGGADCLSRFTLNGFNSLMILDKEPCKPFDQNRQGLNLGEGAAYLVLGNKKAQDQLNVTALAKISGYANANDAHHQTASSPEGKGNQLAMLQALAIAGLQPGQIDYINLHGTGTTNNDDSEGIAIQTVFGNSVPPASSTKAFTGHTLAAAGAVEAVYAVHALQQQVIFPQLRLKHPMANLNWQPAATLQHAAIQHVLSNSFGFGGNCSTLIISKA